VKCRGGNSKRKAIPPSLLTWLYEKRGLSAVPAPKKKFKTFGPGGQDMKFFLNVEKPLKVLGGPFNTASYERGRTLRIVGPPNLQNSSPGPPELGILPCPIKENMGPVEQSLPARKSFFFPVLSRRDGFVFLYTGRPNTFQWLRPLEKGTQPGKWMRSKANFSPSSLIRKNGEGLMEGSAPGQTN